MSKKNRFLNRYSIVLGLLAVFMLVLGTNRIDKNHFETVQTALTSVYEDRVVAQDYIYKMSLLTHEKETQYLNNSSTATIVKTNKKIDSLITLFEKTKLTIREREYFEYLKSIFQDIKTEEADYFKKRNKNVLRAENRQTLIPPPALRNLEHFQHDLDKLAAVQLSESRNITHTAQKSLDMNSIVSTLEIGLLIAIGILIQYFIFYQSKKSLKRSQPTSPTVVHRKAQ